MHKTIEKNSYKFIMEGAYADAVQNKYFDFVQQLYTLAEYMMKKVPAANKTGTTWDGKSQGLFLDFNFIFNQVEFLPFLKCLQSLSFTPELKMTLHVLLRQGCPQKHKTSQ
jgi:hypothetical protein